MAGDRRYIDDISKIGFEKATVKHICEIYGRQQAMRQAMNEIVSNINQMAELMNTVMLVAERMKDRTDKMAKIMGDHVPSDAPTPEDDRMN